MQNMVVITILHKGQRNVVLLTHMEIEQEMKIHKVHSTFELLVYNKTPIMKVIYRSFTHSHSKYMWLGISSREKISDFIFARMCQRIENKYDATF